MKNNIKHLLANIMYWLHEKHILPNHIQVLSMDETLDELLASNKSLVRFGDGEMDIIKGKDIKFQKHEPQLEMRMQEILGCEENGLIVAIPDIFGGLSLYRTESASHWREHLFFYRKHYRRLLNADKPYGNSFVSRPYFMFADRRSANEWFAKIKRIWENKDIVIVEGENTRGGIGNDLFDTAASTERIICPPKDAFAAYDDILSQCKAYPKDRLFIISLGPAAKPLAADLYLAGYRALDMGHVDMEYEWFLRKAEEKTALEKHQSRQ